MRIVLDGMGSDKFPDPESDFVNERFFADWKPDHNWGWQHNRAFVGHIAQHLL